MGRGGRLARNAAAGDIEFVAPRTGLFGSGFEVLADEGEVGPASFGDEPPPPRWGTAIALLAVVGLIAVGVVAAAPWDDEAAPVPTTVPTDATVLSTVPTTRGPVETSPTTVPGTLPPGLDARGTGYVLDDVEVPDFTLQWVDRPNEPRPPDQEAQLRLWAGSNATRASGTWLALEVLRGEAGTWSTLPPDGIARVAVGSGIGTAGVDNDGVAYLQWAIDDGHAGRFTAHGFDVPQLAAIAAGVTLDDAADPVFADVSVLDGLGLVYADAGFGWGLPSELLAWSRSSMWWHGADGRQLRLDTLVADPWRDKTLYDFLLAPIPDEPFTGPKTIWAVGDLTLVVGHLAGTTGATVKWTVGDATMLLSGDVPPAALVDLATKVRPASAAEWRELSRQAMGNESDQEVVDDYLMGPPIGSGTTAQGLGWELQLSVSGNGASLSLLPPPDADDGYGSWTWFFPLAEPTIELATTQRATYVAAVLPAAGGASTLRATGPWGERAEPFVLVTDDDTQTQLLVAALDVVELGGFVVEALAEDGTVLATATAGLISP